MIKQEAIAELRAIKSFEISEYGEENCEETLEALDMAIEALQERKVGRWIAEEIGLRRYATKCSACGIILHEGYNFDNAQEYKEYIDGLGRYDKFCHECGAKMEVDE